jgi:hypothetical protein
MSILSSDISHMPTKVLAGAPALKATVVATVKIA